MNASNPGADTNSESSEFDSERTDAPSTEERVAELKEKRCPDCGHPEFEVQMVGRVESIEIVTADPTLGEMDAIVCSHCWEPIVRNPLGTVVEELVASDIQSAGAE